MSSERSNAWTDASDTLDARRAFPSVQDHDATLPSPDELQIVALSGENLRCVITSECALGTLKEICELRVLHIVMLPSESPDANNNSEGLMTIAVTIDE